MGAQHHICPVLGGAKSFGPSVFPFSGPPFPVINGQSLNLKFYLIVKLIQGGLGRLVPKTIGTGLLVPQAMDDW